MEIDSGDEELDHALELEEELKYQIGEFSELNGFEKSVNLLVSNLNVSAVWEASWRFCDFAGLDDDNHPAPAEELAELVVLSSSQELLKLIQDHKDGLETDEVLELLAESADTESSKRALDALDPSARQRSLRKSSS